MFELLIMAVALGDSEPTALKSGESISIAVGAEASERSFSWRSDISGNVIVAAECAARDPRLVLRSGDERREDLDTAPGTHSACIIVPTEPGRDWTIDLEVATGTGDGSVVVRLVALPESEASRAAAAAFEEALARLKAESQQGELDELRATLGALIDSITRSDEPGTSMALLRTLESAAEFALLIGDFVSAERGWSRVHTRWSTVLGPDHPRTLFALKSLATSLAQLSRWDEARQQMRAVVQGSERTLSADSIDLAKARANLAGIENYLGDPFVARDLAEAALSVIAAALPNEHRDVQVARVVLASAYARLHQLDRARSLEEQAVAALELSAVPDEALLLRARANLAATLESLGDLRAAEALTESALTSSSRFHLPTDLPVLHLRANLAVIRAELGNVAESITEMSASLDALLAGQGGESEDVQRARQQLARMEKTIGHVERARELEEAVLAAWERSRDPEHPDLVWARVNLAESLAALGEGDVSLDLFRVARSALASRPVPDLSLLVRVDDSGVIIAERSGNAVAIESAHAQFLETSRAVFRHALATESMRQVTESLPRVVRANLDRRLQRATSAAGDGAARAENAIAIECLEALRSIAYRSAWLSRRVPIDDGESAAYLAAAEAIASTATGARPREAYLAAVRDRERIERERLRSIENSDGAIRAVDFPNLRDLARTIPVDARAVLFTRWEPGSRSGVPGGVSDEARFCAFVLAQDETFVRIELGGLDAVVSATKRWRNAITKGMRGRGVAADDDGTPDSAAQDLRALILDPVFERIAGATHLIVVLDDPLQTVPLDALPLADGRVGDRFRIELRSCLTERALPSARPVAGGLLAFGNIAYAEQAPTLDQRGASRTAWLPVFEDLGATAAEVAAVRNLYTERFRDGEPAIVREGREATREELFDRASGARFVHLATHGWFAPESVPSTADRPSVSRGPTRYSTFESDVRGLSPMVLCGVALAGARGTADALGRTRGRVTAEELSAFDFGQCELAVLSACETNVGVVRAGQGIASLQSAMHVAGARSVVTSLWRMDDDATAQLMTIFYDRLWRLREPKWKALWEAKKALAELRDVDGGPRHSIRNWSGWVLSGDPE